ncbi:hypothetical protein DSL72_003618 [Monilinia vaccinii-corymbosi]|uniref:Hydrophobin n=1 Tax=Monilinia vaccinii-corymbosi TaxID=61207 RepID=A0A8A3P678_9HELO|nr:hypothetical protein DSL72_003618 [Monilinia vaccinii-corymbosi]
MKISSIFILSIAAITVSGTPTNSIPTRDAIGRKSYNDTTSESQAINTSTEYDTDDVASMNDTSLESPTTTALDPMDSTTESQTEYQPESKKGAQYGRPPRRNKLCGGRLKPRCCDIGGRIYKDGCERLSFEDPPRNRGEFRATCHNMHKIAMCCFNSLDMAQVGIICRKTVR